MIFPVAHWSSPPAGGGYFFGTGKTFSGANPDHVFALNKLVGGYSGSAIRIREDGGGTETDIGFDGSGNLDTAAIASHCGVQNGFVVKWYDQIGAVDAQQTSATAQPMIYQSSAVLTSDGTNHALKFDGSSDYLVPVGVTHWSVYYSASHAVFGSGKFTDATLLGCDNSGNNVIGAMVPRNTLATNNHYWSCNDGAWRVVSHSSQGTVARHTYSWDEEAATKFAAYFDYTVAGGAKGTGSPVPTTIGGTGNKEQIGMYRNFGSPSSFLNGYAECVVMWKTTLSDSEHEELHQNMPHSS